MKQLKLFAGTAAFLLLAGCNDNQAGTNTPAVVDAGEANATAPAGNASVASPGLQLATDGLSVTLADGKPGSAAFGVSREQAVPMAAAAIGEPTAQGTNAECGAGPLENVDFKGGLTLFFQDGKFVGWGIDGRDGSPYKTGAGIGIGTSLQQLRDAGDVAVQETSLGNEFTAGELSGLLTANRPDGKVTNLWAGTTCIFR